jgi:CxxC motif-containing protein
MNRYELICIACPKGCHLIVEGDHPNWHVTGNACIKGEAYGVKEVVDPRRILTTTIRIRHDIHRRLPVVTSAALPKDMLIAALAVINPSVVTPPIYVNQVIFENILGTDINLLSSKTII